MTDEEIILQFDILKVKINNLETIQHANRFLRDRVMELESQVNILQSNQHVTNKS